MTIDLDARWPHDDRCGHDGFCAPYCRSLTHDCNCSQPARIAAHIERLEGALRTIVRHSWWVDPELDECVCCDAQFRVPEEEVDHTDACPVPGIEALIAELGEGT
jgi:hypothetical protein